MKGAEVIERKDTDLFSASSPMALGHFLRDCQRQQTGRDGQVTRKGGGAEKAWTEAVDLEARSENPFHSHSHHAQVILQ